VIGLPLTSAQDTREIEREEPVTLASEHRLGSESHDGAIQRVVADFHQNCDCRACVLMEASRAQALETLDDVAEECESEKAPSDTLPPPAKLPTNRRSQLGRPERCER